MVPVEELAKAFALMCMVDSMVSVEMGAIAAKAEATIGPTGHGHNTVTAKNLKKLLHQTFCRGKWMSTGGTSSPATLLNIEFLKLSRHYPTTSRSFPIHAQYASSGTWRCGMSQVRIHCGLRPGDEVKDIMTKANDIERKKGETLSMYLSRCLQNWLVAERSGVCVLLDVMKLHLLKKGAHLSDSQVDKYNIMTIDKPWDLEWAIRVFHAIDLSASEQTCGRRTQVYMVDDDTSCYQRDEPEDVANVFVSADDQVSMVDDDFEVFLLDFVKSYIFF